MNQLDQLKAHYPNYVFIADPTMPPGLRALNINEIIYFNPNLPHSVILPLLTRRTRSTLARTQPDSP